MEKGHMILLLQVALAKSLPLLRCIEKLYKTGDLHIWLDQSLFATQKGLTKIHRKFWEFIFQITMLIVSVPCMEG